MGIIQICTTSRQSIEIEDNNDKKKSDELKNDIPLVDVKNLEGGEE